MFLKPDRLNGRPVFRGVERGADGINHTNRVVLFAPTISVAPGPVVELGVLVDQALHNLIAVSGEIGDPVIKAQAVSFRRQLKDALAFWMKRAAANERERMRKHLSAHGLYVAASTIGEVNG